MQNKKASDFLLALYRAKRFDMQAILSVVTVALEYSIPLRSSLYFKRRPSCYISIIAFCITSVFYACTELPRPPDASQSIDGIQGAETVLSVGIGSEPEQLGYEPGDESASEGPCSFAVDKDGQIYILDPVKGRIHVYDDNDLKEEIPLPISDAQDIRLLPNGDIVVLDAWVEGKLFVIDRTGSVKNVVEIEGIGLPKARLAGRMFVRPDGVWIEGRRRLVRVMDAQQNQDVKRPILSVNDLSKDGKWLIDYDISEISLTIIMRERDGVPKNRIKHLYFEQPIFGLIGSGFDDQGRLYIATLHDSGSDENQPVNNHLLVLSEELDVLRQIEIEQIKSSPDNLFRNMDVTSNGHVYFLEMTVEKDGSVVRRYQ